MDQLTESEDLSDIKKLLLTQESRGHAEELVDHYWGSINYVFALIRASEIKAGLILSFYGILFNFTYTHVEEVILMASNYFFLYVLLGLWFVSTVGSIYYSIRCFMPKIEDKYEKNMFFFGDVITKYGNIKEFAKTFHQISLIEDELFDQLGQQIYINSKIAAQKFKYVNTSIRLLATGLGLLFIIALSTIIISFW
jgi:hypothetical protein